jgi:hypothetical protein
VNGLWYGIVEQAKNRSQYEEENRNTQGRNRSGELTCNDVRSTHDTKQSHTRVLGQAEGFIKVGRDEGHDISEKMRGGTPNKHFFIKRGL